MRERPKQASYLERQRKIEENTPKISSNIEPKRQPSNVSDSRSAGAIIPKKVERGGDVAVSRVRAGGAKKGTEKNVPSSSGPGGGKMTQYKSLDDIPDGMPDSPQLNKSDRGFSRQENKYDEEEEGGDGDEENDGEQDDYEDYSSYGVPKKTPSAQKNSYSDDNYSEKPLYGGNNGNNGYGNNSSNTNNGNNGYEKRSSVNGSEKLSKYPPLQSGDSGINGFDGKQRPIVYPSTHIKSPSKPGNESLC